MLTAGGIRIAVFYTKVYNRLVVPSACCEPAPGPPGLRADASGLYLAGSDRGVFG